MLPYLLTFIKLSPHAIPQPVYPLIFADGHPLNGGKYLTLKLILDLVQDPAAPRELWSLGSPIGFISSEISKRMVFS